MVGYDDFLCMIIWYEEHLNVNMCILEICMVLVYEIIECEYIDWWPFDVVRPGSNLRPNRDTPWEEQVGDLHHYPYLC
jgi:hypothetical protein